MAGVQLNCQVVGQNPRMLNVQAGGTTETTFEVGCLPTGSLRVIAETAGEDFPSAYTVTAYGIVRSLAANGKETVDGMPEGPVDVELRGVASNCAVEGSNPRSVTVVAGSTVVTTFSTACGPSIWATKAPYAHATGRAGHRRGGRKGVCDRRLCGGEWPRSPDGGSVQSGDGYLDRRGSHADRTPKTEKPPVRDFVKTESSATTRPRSDRALDSLLTNNAAGSVLSSRIR